jgi:hypothetical protein
MDETGDSSVLLVARCLVAGLFLWSGIGKVSGYGETSLLMSEHGVIGLLLPVAIFVEIGGALLLIIGFRARLVAIGLAGFCVATAAVARQLHRPHADVPFLQEPRDRGRPARPLCVGSRPHVVRRAERGVRLAWPCPRRRCT